MSFPTFTLHGRSLVLRWVGGVIALGLAMQGAPIFGAETRPNIIVILADDLGYGDVQCNNPERGKIPTPHIDRLASEGLRFTDAHTSSGVCSPTRYSLLSGRYHWRSRLQSGIVGLWEKPLIAPERLTLASLLKQHGYRTAAIGKWHLGWDWPIKPEQMPAFKGLGGKAGGGGDAAAEATEAQRAIWREVFAQPIGGGPTARGFDEYFGTDVPNWPPYAFIENDRVSGVPSELLPAPLLRKNLASLQGPALPGWTLEPILPALGDRACAFLERASKASEPFFLYLPLTVPHTPIVPNAEWRGKSGLGDYGDLVMEMDALVGRVLSVLQKSGAADRTLVVFTSDNGCASYIGAAELEARGHFPSGPLRGYKADAWEGGHRVPFIVRWPGVVKAGTRCDQLTHQADLMATFAEVLGAKLPPNAGEDSVSLLPLWRGSDAPVREQAISQAASGLPALRQGSWKIIFGQGAGGFGARRAAGATEGPPGQLYDLATDLGETKNLWTEKPELVAELTASMDKLVAEGRSTPGAKQSNDVPVNWRRFLTPVRPANPP